MKNTFKGVFTALITPFTEYNTVDYISLERLVDAQISAGIDGLVPCGTTGESPTLSHEEHDRVIAQTIRFAKGRVPVIAGTGSNDTAYSIELTRYACEHGADGVLVVTPYYNKTTQEGLIRHYSAIARETKLPIILYNVPGRTGCNLMPETVAALVKNEPNIVGLKEATGNMAQASKTMYLCDGNLDLYSGEDGLVLPLMSIGAKGVISVWSDVAPAQVHQMCQSFFDGDIETARRLQAEALPLVDALFSEVNPIPVKKALNLMGKEVGPLRAPLCEMSEANAAVLAKVMKEYGIL